MNLHQCPNFSKNIFICIFSYRMKCFVSLTKSFWHWTWRQGYHFRGRTLSVPWNNTVWVIIYLFWVCHFGKTALLIQKRISPSSSSWMEPLTETQIQKLPPVIWNHKHTHTVIHLLLTNSSDNGAEFSINFLIIHSDGASVKTKTFLSLLLSHTFLQKKDSVRNYCDLLEI